MKQSESGRNPVLVQKRALEKPDSQKALTKPMPREKAAEQAVLTACEVTGTQSLDAADRFISQVGNALVWPKPQDANDHVIRASALISELAPKNATETMLAAQMIAVNDAAMMFLRRATLADQTFEGTEANVARATRLMRLFTEQLEAMQKLKGKTGQQKVTVEHVHVHQGGQAIVGQVSANGRE